MSSIRKDSLAERATREGRAFRQDVIAAALFATSVAGLTYLVLPSSQETPVAARVTPIPTVNSPSLEVDKALATRAALLSPEPSPTATPLISIFLPVQPVGTEPQISQQYASELSTGQTLNWLIRTTEAGNEVTLVECNNNMEGIVNPDSGAGLFFSPDGLPIAGFGLDASSSVAWRKGIEVTGPNRNDVFAVDPKVTGNGNPNTPDSQPYFALSERKDQSPAITRINRGPIDCVRVPARRFPRYNRDK
jgi:hypothetical protein